MSSRKRSFQAALLLHKTGAYQRDERRAEEHSAPGGGGGWVNTVDSTTTGVLSCYGSSVVVEGRGEGGLGGTHLIFFPDRAPILFDDRKSAAAGESRGSKF